MPIRVKAAAQVSIRSNAAAGTPDRAIAAWRDEPGIQILGNQALPRLSIVSFTVRHDGRYLHHNLVVALLYVPITVFNAVGESWLLFYGLGIALVSAQATAQTEKVWAAAFVATALAGVGYAAIATIGRLLTPWAPRR